MHWNILKVVASTTLLFLSLQAQAVTPRNNWYAGIFLGPSATGTSSFGFGREVTFQRTVEGTNYEASISASSARLTYSVLGGIGGQIGYRFCNRHRIEGEFYYNNNPIQKLQLYDYKVTATATDSSGITTDLFGMYPKFSSYENPKVFNNVDNTSEPHIMGETNTGAFMLNFIYDLLTPDQSGDGYNKVAPFIGVGIGYAYVQNAMQFYRQTTEDPADDPYKNRQIFSVLQKKYIYAGQIMGGINYFLDDFTWMGIDIRYFTTGSSTARSRYTYTSPNYEVTKTVSSNSSIFSNKTQILSANLSFSGTLNL